MAFTIGRKLSLGFLFILALFVIISAVIIPYNQSIKTLALGVQKDDVPGAVFSLSMLEEMGDMNGNVLDYLVGESDEKEDFSANDKEFNGFFEKMKALETRPEEIQRMNEIAALHDEYVESAIRDIFETFNPDDERWAIQQLRSIKKTYGNPLESLLDRLTEAEKKKALDISASKTLDEVRSDVLAVAYYSALVDEAGDLISDLSEYINGTVEEKDAFASDAKEFEAFFAQVKSVRNTSEHKADLDEIFSLYTHLKQGGEEVFNRYNPKNKIDAIAAADRIEHEAFKKIEIILDALAAEEERDVMAGTEQVINAVKQANRITLILTFTAIIVGIIISFVLTRAITGPLHKAVSIAEQLSEGELTMHIQSSGTDELGQLLGAMQKMVTKLREVIGHVSTASNNVSLGSQGVSSIAMQISQGASTQAASTEEASSSMEQMVANIRQSSDNALQTESIATKAASDARTSEQAVTEMVNAMREIAQKTSIIGDITRQTRLLSLNATIEAARAQEHGRGFAVVASEVRDLAERSQVAAVEITQIVSDSVITAEKAEKMLRQLVPDIQKTAQLVQEISAAGKEQNSGAEQINQAIQQLDQVTQQNSVSSEEMAATAEELTAQAEQLQNSVTFFNT